MSGRWAMLKSASERKRMQEGAPPRPAHVLQTVCIMCRDIASSSNRKSCRAAGFARAMRMSEYVYTFLGAPCATDREVETFEVQLVCAISCRAFIMYSARTGSGTFCQTHVFFTSYL